MTGKGFIKAQGDARSIGITVDKGAITLFLESMVSFAHTAVPRLGYYTTRNAVIEVSLPLAIGIIIGKWYENEEGCDLDPLLHGLSRLIDRCWAMQREGRGQARGAEHGHTAGYPRNGTGAFLGPESQWGGAIIRYRDMGDLYGGRDIVVRGSGDALVQVVSIRNDGSPGLWERQYVCQVFPKEVSRIFSSLLGNDFVTIEPEERPGVPDETRVMVALTNARGLRQGIETWERTPLLRPGNTRVL